MNWLGIDIGGANLKVADGRGYANSQPFALWRQHHALAEQLRLLIAQAPHADRLAVTMTGELADCFETKSEGVRFILDAVQQAAEERPIRVYLTTGELVTPGRASQHPEQVAAANWHALGAYTASLVPEGFGLVIDVGSTTTDIIPVLDGRLAARATDDTGRLVAGESWFTSASSGTPVCALLERVPYRAGTCPIANELFATSLDAFLILGDLPEDPTSTCTADGRLATRPFAGARLSRMICADSDSLDQGDLVAIAQTVADAGLGLLRAGIERVIAEMGRTPEVVVAAGTGEFLVRRAISQLAGKTSMTTFAEQFGREPSQSAPAHAVAAIAREARIS